MTRRVLLILALCLAAMTTYAYAMDPEGCIECHEMQLIVKAGQAYRNLRVAEKEYRLSSHGSLYCSDCHASETIVPHEPGNREAVCFEKCHSKGSIEEVRKVHTEKYYSYQDDIHYKEGIGCADCHSEFGKVKTYAMSLKCLTCHGKNGEGKGVLLVSTPVHGDLTGVGGVVTCGDCHSPHIPKEKRTEETLNCYRGSECHGNRVVRKIAVGGHLSSGGGRILGVIREAVRIVVVLFLLVGVGLILSGSRKNGR